uniref:Uncharacterized protein n=1 Tax=Oryza meridionalis TaxID=40149 RepID=A0A0E0CTN7_9ORYZ
MDQRTAATPDQRRPPPHPCPPTDQRRRCYASTARPPHTNASLIRRSPARDCPRRRRGGSPYCRSRCGARLATPDHCSAKPPPRSHVPLIPISGVFVFASPCPGSLRGGGGVAVPDRILPMRPWLSRSKCMRALAACRPALRQSGWPDAIGSEVCCPCARLLSFAMVLVWPPFD